MTRFAMIRAALLGVEEAAAIVAGDAEPDALTLSAVNLAWGSPQDGSSRPDERPYTTTLRYVARMGGRATPFGLFAGTQHVAIGRERRLALDDRDRHRVLTRVDTEALQTTVADAMTEVGPERWLVRRNGTLREAAGSLRYTKSGDATADVVTLRPTPAIMAVLETVGEKTVLVAEVLDTLAAMSPGQPRDALRDFVTRLVETGLLHRAVDLAQPGAEPVDLALTLLDRIGDPVRGRALAELVRATGGDQPLSVALADRLDTAWDRATAALPPLAEVPRNRRYHLDLELAMRERTLDDRTVTDLADAVRRLELFLGRPGYLAGFREAFKRRYEDAEVPLLTALDAESGVLRRPARETSSLARLAGVRHPGHHPDVEISTELLDVLGRWTGGETAVDLAHLPLAEHSTARGLFAALLDEETAGFHSMLIAGYQRSPMALVGRFAFGRPEMAERLGAWQRERFDVDESDPAAPIHAELVYSPGDRFGNILLRPRLYDETIALDGGAGGSLSLDRLLVRVDGDVVRLREAVTGRDVVVEMNTPHNVTADAVDPIYSFLGILVSPGAIGWSWGALTRLPHLPRITCGRVIVSPERWTITGADVRGVLADREPGARLRALLPGIGDRRWIGLGDDDRLLPVDLESRRSIEVGLARSGRADKVELTELPHVEHPAMAGPRGRHVAEVVVPMRPVVGPVRHTRRADRYDPAAGDAWVYFRYDCGSSTADTVIARAGELAERLLGTHAEDWFFIRYRDDTTHVRVRVRPGEPRFRPQVLVALDRLGAQLREEGLVSRAAMDQYVPEVTRYGGERCLPLAEAVFTADSAAVAAFVASGPSELVRLCQAVATMTHWIRTVFESPDEQHEFAKRCARGLGLRFAPTGNPHGRFYREKRSYLDDYLATAVPDAATTARLEELVAGLRTHAEPARLQQVLASVLHMHCNRLFSVDGRRLEFLAHDIVARKLREYRARGDRRTGDR